MSKSKTTASKFSKVVIYIRSFLQILYHSITAKVVAINIQASKAVIQGVFLYHSSITSETGRFYQTSVLPSLAFEKAYKIIE